MVNDAVCAWMVEHTRTHAWLLVRMHNGCRTLSDAGTFRRGLRAQPLLLWLINTCMVSRVIVQKQSVCSEIMREPIVCVFCNYEGALSVCVLYY